MTRDPLAWYKREQRKVDRLPSGLSVRLTLHFTQEELRLLADGGVMIAPPVLRRWIRDEVLATHLDGLRVEDEFWRSPREDGERGACSDQRVVSEGAGVHASTADRDRP